jgi:hypothetical protein
VGRRALFLVPLLVIVFLIVVWVGWLLLLAGVWTRPETLPNIDFFAFWAASSLTLDGNPAGAYDVVTLTSEQVPLPGEDAGFQHKWLNPPFSLFVILPLGLIPVAASLAVWVLLQGALAAAAIRRISGDRMVLCWAVAFPATMWNFIIGQNGFLTAGLLAWGVILLRDRPALAGVFFGLIAYKPQFFPLVLVALLAGRQRSATVSTLSTIAALSFASLLLFGFHTWDGFLRMLIKSGDALYTSTAPIDKMQSVSAVLLLADLPPDIVKLLQALVALACAWFVAWLWRGDAAIEYKGAGLALVSLLATPYAYHYDLTLLGLAALWLGVAFQREGWRPWDIEVLGLAWLAPLLAVISARMLDFTIGPAVLILMLAVLIRRVRSAGAPMVEAPASAAVPA